jgi:hemolysin activation/secretion protein
MRQPKSKISSLLHSSSIFHQRYLYISTIGCAIPLLTTLPAFAAPDPQPTSFTGQLLAQAAPTTVPPNQDFQRPTTTPSEAPQPLLPAPENLIPTPTIPKPSSAPTDFSNRIVVKKFEIVGSTVFTPAELAQLTAPDTNRPIDFNQLLQVANRITQLYASKGYVTSGAYIPGNQTFDPNGAVVRIVIVEGRVEDIVVTGTQKLNPNYIRSRIGLGSGKPLQIDRLLESLRLLQQDPLIKSISTELTAGKEPGTSIIQLKVIENPTWRVGFSVANNRTPSVGEIQAQTSISQSNLTGAGDSLALTYGRSEASNAFDVNYTIPLNPHNGTLKLQYSRSDSRVIEAPFEQLDISGRSQDISLSYRQPLVQTTSEEFALGVTIATRETNTTYLPSATGERLGYPSPGADDNGTTRIAAVRFFQDYTVRDTQQVFAARSQVSLGMNAFDAINSPSSPNSNFFTWRGQTQYVRSLAPNSILLLRLEGQLADRPLVALEQIGIGGQETVRGYRQDLLLGDNGLLASAEVRIPIFTPANSRQIIQVVPFVDFGTIWNQSASNTSRIDAIGSAGIGLRYNSGDNFFVKIDYGIPFTAVNQTKRTGQEGGFHVLLGYNQSF